MIKSYKEDPSYKEDLLIYGFGSYFNGRTEFQDIDLLIVHDNTDEKSCIFAIKLKEIFSTQINDAHISILSKKEVMQLDFIRKSKSILIGSVSSNAMSIEAIAIREKIIGQHPAPSRNTHNVEM